MATAAKRNLVDIIDKYRKQRKAYSGDEIMQIVVPRIRTGIFSLDYQTGGGIPRGRLTIYHGQRSSGKTTTAIHTCNNFRKQVPNQHVAYFDFESAIDGAWGGKALGNRDRFHLVLPDYGEEGVDMITEVIGAPEVGFLIIDSVAMITPMKTIERSAIDGSLPGNQAKLVNDLIRKIVPVIAQRKKSLDPNDWLTVLFLNQVRPKIGGAGAMGFEVPEKPGGKLQTFMASLDVRFYEESVSGNVKDPKQKKHKFLLEKNKVGPSHRKGGFMINVMDNEMGTAGTIDNFKQVISAAKLADFIVRDGSKWVTDDQSFKTLEEVDAYYLSNRERLEALQEAVLVDLLSRSGTLEDEGE